MTLWIDQLRRGDEEAADQLWHRYFSRLTALARSRVLPVRTVTDEEDVALSALKSVFVQLRSGGFPALRDRTELWPLLVKITLYKAANQVKRQYAQKRSPAAEDRDVDPESLLAIEPGPEFFVEMADLLEHLMQKLSDEHLMQIAQLRLEGHSMAEIAEAVGVGQRTVARKLVRIRCEWQEQMMP